MPSNEMHAVTRAIREQLQGFSHKHRIAVICGDGGTGSVIIAGMLARLGAYGFKAQIVGGTSGGALAAIYYALGQATLGATVHRYLAREGMDGNGGRRFINKHRLLLRQPIMDVEALIDEVMTYRMPLNWHKFVNLETSVFVTVTLPNGQPHHVLLNGEGISVAKAYAKATAMIPYVATRDLDRAYWDGGISDGLPIQTAFRYGATHVLVLRAQGQRDEPRASWGERRLLQPWLQRRAPKLAAALAARFEKKAKLAAAYRLNPRVQFVELTHTNLHPLSNDWEQLFRGMLDGWDAVGRALNLPPLDYPVAWHPDLRRLVGLA